MIKFVLYFYLLSPTPERVLNECISQGLKYPKIVVTQAILETGWFKSYSCVNRNNLFGLTKHDGNYFDFTHWRQSIKAYKTKVQYKYKYGNYYEFLERIGYATDPNYINKLKKLDNILFY